MNAYNELASDGLVEGHVGRGTLVRRSHYSLADDTLDSDDFPGSTVSPSVNAKSSALMLAS